MSSDKPQWVILGQPGRRRYHHCRQRSLAFLSCSSPSPTPPSPHLILGCRLINRAAFAQTGPETHSSQSFIRDQATEARKLNKCNNETRPKERKKIKGEGEREKGQYFDQTIAVECTTV